MRERVARALERGLVANALEHVGDRLARRVMKERSCRSDQRDRGASRDFSGPSFANPVVGGKVAAGCHEHSLAEDVTCDFDGLRASAKRKVTSSKFSLGRGSQDRNSPSRSGREIAHFEPSFFARQIGVRASEETTDVLVSTLVLDQQHPPTCPPPFRSTRRLPRPSGKS